MKHKVVAISGSLEENALAGNILKKCALLAEQNLQIEILSIKNLPLLNVDLFQNGFPSKIEELRSKIHHCDALLFAVPEYIGKVSPAFKNAYDWLSYSPTVAYPSPILKKPAVMITLGPGDDGLHLQKHFLQIGQFCKLKIMSKPNLHFSTR
jgi:chromate reductase